MNPLQFKFAYTITKERTSPTGGFCAEEAFEILVRAMASNMPRVFNLTEDGYLFTPLEGKHKGNTYYITLQD